MLRNLSSILLQTINLRDPAARQRLTALIAQLIPCHCQLCGMQSPQVLCSICVRHYLSGPVANPSRRCRYCAIPIATDDRACGTCLQKRPAFDRTLVACDYIAPLDQLVLALKFGRRLAIAPALAQMLASTLELPDSYPLPDILIPVPLSRQRLAQRGFNQALEIAKPLARLTAIPLYPTLLQRVRDTTAQTRLHPNQRLHNIAHAFALNSDYADKISNRHIGVVDDVMTTGATLHEIAACLKRQGAQRVTNIVFARTPPH